MAGSLLQKVTDKLVDCLWDEVKDQINYLCCYSCNVQRLADEVPTLNDKKRSVEQDVDAARNNFEVIRPEVETWLKETEMVLTKSNMISEDAAQVQKSCLPRWCPVLHYTLSRNAKETTEKSIELKNTCNFARISNPVNPEDIDPVSVASEIGLMSRSSLENKIMDALQDERVYLIGLCGMGGLGKTTMAQKIEKRVHGKRKDSGFMFKHVVMVVVSQTVEIPKIQDEIIEGLGLQMKQECPRIRAKLLCDRLKDLNGVLIILDDVWERLDLDEIGIPPPSAKCKLILTSRSQHALRLTENAEILPLGVLTDEESWILFKKNVGDVVDTPDLHNIAEDVVKECKGLPLALVTVGRALRGRRKSSWEDARLQLQQSMPRNIPDVLKYVYGPLLLSFNHLESEEYRYLLLLCCLFPEDSYISFETLLRYGIGLEIFGPLENLVHFRNRLEAMLEYLCSSSLLTETGRWRGNQCVKIHDVIRDMCIWITSKEKIESEGESASREKHIFKISHGKQGWPMGERDSYGNYSCISLTFSQPNTVVSGTINCPILELLHIDCQTVLADDFFSGVGGLKVLEASGIKSIPSSIQVLKNLRTLHLTSCRFEKTPVAVLGELKNLEILCFRYCYLEMLPKEMGELKKLRKLDIKHCSRRRGIEYGVVSRLDQLEELDIIDNLVHWEATEDEAKFLVELDSLRHLTTLHLRITSSTAIPKRKPHWVQRLKRYSLDVSGDHRSKFHRLGNEFHRAIKLFDSEGTRFEDWFYDMTRDAECLILRGPNCMFVVNHLCRSGYQNLKDFTLSDFSNVQYLSYAFGDGQFMGVVFPILKHLSIEKSTSLQEISNGSPPAGSFEALEKIVFDRLPSLLHLWGFPSENLGLSNLKILEITDCGSLLYLLPLPLGEGLPRLTKLKVSDCPVVKEIFKKEEGGMEITIKTMELPKLESLVLESLGSLHKFCKVVEEIDVPNLCELRISKLPRMMEEGYSNIHQPFLFDQVVAGNSLKLRMFCPFASFNFSTGLQELSIGSIHNIKSFFSHSTLRFFPSLEKLDIFDCSALEEVIRGDEENVPETKVKTTILPRLEYLYLSNLQNILSFCHGMSNLELPSVKEIGIKDCPLMKTFVRGISSTNKSFFNEKVFCPRLKRIELEKLNIEGIFSHNSIDNFCTIENLSVKFCHRMKNLFSPLAFKNLNNLRFLDLEDCEELNEVIAKEDEEDSKNIKASTLSSQLVRVTLNRLPKMQTFWPTSNHLELPSLEWVNIYGDCSMLERFSLGPLNLPRFKGVKGLLDHDRAVKFFFNKEKSSHEIHLENNCFTIFARDLSIDTAPPDRLSWVLMPNSSTDSFVDVAMLRWPHLNEITGKFDIIKLSAEVVYEVIFMIMLEEGSETWEEPVDLKLTLSGQITQHRREIWQEKPRGEWIDILVGEFMREPHQIGDLEFSIRDQNNHYLKQGPYIKGAKIQMKA